MPAAILTASRGCQTALFLLLQIDTPSADVHAGFVLRLKWVRGDTATPGDKIDVTSDGTKTDLFVPYSEVDTSDPNKWQVRIL